MMCVPLYSMSLDPHRLEASRSLGGAKVGSELGLQGRGEGRKERLDLLKRHVRGGPEPRRPKVPQKNMFDLSKNQTTFLIR